MRLLAAACIAVSLLAIGCGSANNKLNDEACPNLAQLQQDLQSLQDVNGKSSVGDLRALQQKVKADVAAVKKSAAKSHSDQLDALDKAYNDLAKAAKSVPDNTSVNDAVKQLQPQIQAVATARTNALNAVAKGCK
jgi:hypothetical protein